MNDQLIQLTSIGIIFIFAIKEFFAYLKTRKNNHQNGNSANSLILEELKRMNDNHLHTLRETIIEGNGKLIETIHQDNAKIIEILSEIKGRLK